MCVVFRPRIFIAIFSFFSIFSWRLFLSYLRVICTVFFNFMTEMNDVVIYVVRPQQGRGAWGGLGEAINWWKAAVSEAAEKLPQKDLLAFSWPFFLCVPFCSPFVSPSLNCKFENIFLCCSSHFLLRTAVKAVSKAPAENNASNTLSRCEWWRIHTSI